MLFPVLINELLQRTVPTLCPRTIADCARCSLAAQYLKRVGVQSSTEDFVDFEKATLNSRFFVEKANLINRGPSPQTRGRFIVQASQLPSLLILPTPREFYGFQVGSVMSTEAHVDMTKVKSVFFFSVPDY